MAQTISDPAAREILGAGRIGRLACVDRDGPYVVPINYLFEGDCVYSHSLPGQKINALRANSRACLQVDEIVDDFHWRSALAFGNFEEVVDELERTVILRKLFARFPLLTPVESLVARDAAPPDAIVFRIRVNRVSGVIEG
jgi:nitroimidazol reductase NimA-like FMN-containing flavoprotein (pyridoxamine 5'-phosphate oxidase superfamily)